MTLKHQILKAFAAAKNEHERGLVLSEIAAARHEIRVEYMAADPALRLAIAELELRLESIMRGQYRIAACDPMTSDNDREAPLVGLAGYIAMLLVVRANQREETYAELRGWTFCASRVEAARAVTTRKHAGSARPCSPDATTGYVPPPNPLSLECENCGAAVGVTCGGVIATTNTEDTLLVRREVGP